MAEDEAPLLSSAPGTPTRTSFEWERSHIPVTRKRQCTTWRRLCLFALLVVLCVVLLAFVYHGLAILPSPARAADLHWIATSDSTFDRITCRWIGVCGLLHWWRYYEPPAFGRPEDLEGAGPSFSDAWIDPLIVQNPEKYWSAEERAARTIPDYVFAYSPFIFLLDDERYWPSDPAEHLLHSHVQVGDDKDEIPLNISLATLGQLNEIKDSDEGQNVFLVSNDDPDDRPEWMLSRRNRPGFNTSGPADRSNAPAILISVRKPDGILDAFFFFYYSFNEGNTVFGTRYGNHIGDWEHTMVRFRDGQPQSLYLSRHSWGSAYTYESMDKIDGTRPTVYAGNGSHAHYPTAGDQPYVLPFGILKDVTARSVRCDPTLNLQAYTYTIPDEAAPEGTFRAALQNPRAPTSWLEFKGRWGDARYPLGDERQYRFFGETHFAGGPTGPRDKRLDRENVCDSDKCRIEGSVYR